MDLQLESSVFRRDFLKMAAAGTALAAMPLLAHSQPKKHPPMQSHKDLAGGMALLKQEVVDTLTPKDFTPLIGKVKGLSESQLRQHFKLYEGYVNKLNSIHQAIAQADDAMLSGTASSYAPYRELHVEQSFSQNGVVLHELYFGNLGSGSEPTKEVKAIIEANFGTWDGYLKHLVAVGKSMRGWAMTGFDLRDGKVRNFGLDLHNQGSPTHFYPLLVLDVYEHAYMVDYGTDRSKYLTAFLSDIDWQAVHQRLMFAVHHLMAGPTATA